MGGIRSGFFRSGASCRGLDTHLPWILGVFALFCYNGLYTPLKKKTLFAVWPGVICGMLAPAIGWTAVPQALGHGTRIQLFGVMLVMGIWQVPHFLVLAAAQPVCDPGRTGFQALSACGRKRNFPFRFWYGSVFTVWVFSGFFSTAGLCCRGFQQAWPGWLLSCPE